MPIPAGITVALVHMDAPLSFIGEPGRVHITITPSVPLIWEATGTPIINFFDVVQPANGQPFEVYLPHTDQDGFLDGNGNTFEGWYYTVKITYEKGGQRLTFPDRDFQILTGQDDVDLALVPAGGAYVPSVAPILPVTSIEGHNGAVTLADLGLELVDNTPDADKPVSTATAAALAQKIARGELVINVKDYGVTGDGVADDAPEIAAAVAAVPDGGVLWFPSGQTYLCNSSISATGKSFTIYAHGATFIKNANVALFDFTGGYDTPLAVTSLGVAVITDDTQSSDTGTAITVAAGPSWVRGDVVKLYADDVIPGGRPGTGDGNEARVGHYLVVSNVTGNTINCLGTVDDPFTTTIRVARLQKRSVKLFGGTFITAATGLSGSWATNMIQFRSMHNPVVRDAHILSTAYAGFQFTGCYGYTVESSDVGYAKNDAVNSIYGYGISDRACAYGRVNNYRARRVRHAFTDGSPFIAAATTDPANYGRSYGGVISNSVAYGTANTGWDTHSWSRNMTFLNCQAVNCYKAFNARGRFHKFINCQAIKCATGGVYIANESTGGETFGHYVQNFYAEDTPRALEVYINQTDNPLAGTRELRQSIVDGLTIRGGANEGVYVRNATIRLDRLHHVMSGAVTSTDRFIYTRNGVLEGGTWTQDARGLTSGSLATLMVPDLASSVSVNHWDYITSTANAGFVNYGIDPADAASVVKVEKMVMSHPLPAPHRTLAAGSYVDWECLSDGQSAAWITGTDAAIANASTGPVYSLATTRAERVFFRLSANAGAQTLAALPAGNKRGQTLIIWNISTSNTVTVSNGTTPKTTLIGSASKVLAPQERITLVWQNSTWWQIQDAPVLVASNNTRYQLSVDTDGALITTAM